MSILPNYHRVACLKVKLAVARHNLQQQPGLYTAQLVVWKRLTPKLTHVEGAELYMAANNMPEARRVAIFLNCVGKTTYVIIRRLMIPDKPGKKSLKDIITVMEKHFELKPLVIFERFKFNKCVQLLSETVSEYVVELRKLLEHCKFEAFLDNGSQFAA